MSTDRRQTAHDARLGSDSPYVLDPWAAYRSRRKPTSTGVKVGIAVVLLGSAAVGAVLFGGGNGSPPTQAREVAQLQPPQKGNVVIEGREPATPPAEVNIPREVRPNPPTAKRERPEPHPIRLTPIPEMNRPMTPEPAPTPTPVPPEPPPPPPPTPTPVPDAPEEKDGAKWYQAHQGPIQSLAIAPDGKRFLSLDGTQMLFLWYVAKREPMWKQSVDGPPIGVAFLARGTKAVYVTEGEAVIVDLTTGESLRRYPAPRGHFVSLTALPDGDHFLTGCSDGTVRIWNSTETDMVGQIDVHPQQAVSCLAVNDDGTQFVAGCLDGSVNLVDMAMGRVVVRKVAHRDGVSAVAISADSQQIASAGADRTVRLWDGKLTRALTQSQPGEHVMLALAFSPVDQRLIAAGTGPEVKIWNLKAQPSITTFSIEAGANALAINPAGSWVLVGGRDSDIHAFPLPEAMMADLPQPTDTP